MNARLIKYQNQITNLQAAKAGTDAAYKNMCKRLQPMREEMKDAHVQLIGYRARFRALTTKIKQLENKKLVDELLLDL